jgi:hypothetical protein
MTKRFYFIALSFISAFGLIAVSSAPLSIRGYSALLLAFLSSLLLLASFRLKMGKFSVNSIFSLFGPTFLLPLGFGLIFVHFPNFSVFFRTLVYILYLISYYFSILIGNILFVVTAEGEKIPLLRAAQAASYVISTGALFLLLTALYKTDTYFIFQSLGVFVAGFILSFQVLSLTKYLGSKMFEKISVGSLLFSVLLFESSMAFSFVPLKSFSRALVISGFFYLFIGIYQNFLAKTLNRKVLFEYVGVILLIFFTVFFLE